MMLGPRQDLNQRSNLIHINDFNEANECFGVERADELTALKVRFVLHLHFCEVLSEMPKPLALADLCFVINSLDSFHERSVERDRSDANALFGRAPDVLARFLRQLFPPILEAWRRSHRPVVPCKRFVELRSGVRRPLRESEEVGLHSTRLKSRD